MMLTTISTMIPKIPTRETKAIFFCRAVCWTVMIADTACLRQNPLKFNVGNKPF